MMMVRSLGASSAGRMSISTLFAGCPRKRNFLCKGDSGTQTLDTSVQLSVVTPFSVQCVPQQVDVVAGSTNTTTCTVTSVAYTGNADLSCTGSLPCSMNPVSIAVSPGNPADSILTLSPDISATAGDYPIQVDAASATFTAGTEVTATVSTVLLLDQFNDNTLTWSVLKGNWAESGEFLSISTLDAAKIFAPLPWSPSGVSGCITCSHSVQLATAGLPGRISIFGWYVDNKNYVEVLIKDDADKVILRQKSNGRVLREDKGAVRRGSGRESSLGNHIRWGHLPLACRLGRADVASCRRKCEPGEYRIQSEECVSFFRFGGGSVDRNLYHGSTLETQEPQ